MRPVLPDLAVLRDIVALSARAPSIHNTQPWRWRADRDGLALYADPDRRLMYADLDGRQQVASCGAALHTLVVAAAAAGWAATVRRRSGRESDERLATVTFEKRAPSPEDQTLADAARVRRTDRREVSSWPVPDDRLAKLGHIAAEHGVLLTVVHALEGEQVLRRQLAEASRVQGANEAYLDELLAWTRAAREPEGVPRGSLLARSAAARLTSLDTRFPAGTLVDSHVEDLPSEARLLVLGTSSDDALSWLRSGEALMAIWLECTREGLSVVPYSQPVEVEATRAVVREQLLHDASCPQMVVRVGWTPMSREAPDPTARRPVDSILEVAAT